MAKGKRFEEIAIGDRAQMQRIVRAEDLIVFAHASGNLNPLHLPTADKDDDGRPDEDAVAPAMWVGSLFSALLGNVLPGPGAIYRRQTIDFRGRARMGDVLSVEVEAVAKSEADRTVAFACRAIGPDGSIVAEGEAVVCPPETPLASDEAWLPGLTVRRHAHAERLFAACEGLKPLRTAVVAPEEERALGGALLAARRGLVTPILVGSRAAMETAAVRLGASLAGLEILDAHDHEEAAAKAVALVREGGAEALMKGALHTDQLLKHVIAGLRTGRRLTHVFVFDVPGLRRLLYVSDAAIAIAPTLEEKVDIVQNAIDLARALGAETPHVGVLSAVETVNPKIPSTLDAAALSKMAERGQITGGIVDGPLAMDNAVDPDAARAKGIASLVAGRADVLIAPNLEAGNILVKELGFISGAEGAGVVLGAKAPIILTSRADDEASRLMSCAIALLWRHWRESGSSRLSPQPR